MTTEENQLLPCPFCDHFTKLHFNGSEYTPLKSVEIHCLNDECGTTQLTLTRRESIDFTKNLAITKWNTRISKQSKIDVDEVEKLLNLYAIELKEEYYNEEILNKFLTQEKTNEIKININFRVGKMVEETRHRIGYTTEQLTKK